MEGHKHLYRLTLEKLVGLYGKRIGMETQRDGMGREVGEGIGMGNTCESMADSCQCMAKTTTIL